jgi:hypothetical protein
MAFDDELDGLHGYLPHGTGLFPIARFPTGVPRYVLQFPADGGTAGYVLRTDGTGITTWVPQTGGGGGGDLDTTLGLGNTSTNSITLTDIASFLTVQDSTNNTYVSLSNNGASGQIVFLNNSGFVTSISADNVSADTTLQLPRNAGTLAIKVNNQPADVGGGILLTETSGATGQTSYATGDILYASAANTLSKLTIGSANKVLTVVGGVPTWQTPTTGTVTTLSVVSANGFAGSVATASSTPAITLTTTISGLLKGNGTAISAATAGTDYLTPTGSAAGLTSFPTLNQNTTGSASTLTTSRNINGVAFNGSTDITITAAAGTLTGTTLNSTVVNSSLTSHGTITSGGLGTGAVIGGVTMTLGSDASFDIYYRNGSGVLTRLANGTTGQYLIATTSSAPSWGTVTQAAAAGTLTGTTLNSTVVTSSLTAIGTLASGAVPASLVTAGTFGAGAYTMGTSLTNPLLIGGTAAGSSLTLQSTSGTGTTSSILFKVGTNGGTTAGTISNSGNWDFGGGSLTTTSTLNCGTIGCFNVISTGLGRFASGSNIGWTSSTQLNNSSTDGILRVTNNAGTDFTRMQFGGTTSSFPALKRSTTTLQFVLADDSGFAASQDLYNRFGSGTPEGSITAPVGAIYHRTDGGANTSLYVKESGAGNTGWVAK